MCVCHMLIKVLTYLLTYLLIYLLTYLVVTLYVQYRGTRIISTSRVSSA